MIWTLVVATALATSVGHVVNPRDQGGWVSDGAKIIDPPIEARLEQLLGRLNRDLTAEVAVVTVASADQPPKEFATALFNHWQMGDRNANNGLLVLVVVDRRRMEMETGYGLEAVVPDGWLGAMQADVMVPQFKGGKYGEGLLAGVEALDRRLRQYPDDVRLGTNGPIAVARSAEASRRSRNQALAVGGGSLALGSAVFAAGFVVVRSRRRERTCDTCDLYMPMLSEEAEDPHLERVQQLEESLGSIDWQVHQCPKCSAVRTFPKEKWFSGFSRCPKCSGRTRVSQSTTEIHASTFNEGRVRIDESCRNCSYRHSTRRSTPRLQTHSSGGSSSGGSSFGGGFGGGSSGGGSFGGGSSGGGGAGSSW